jgi:hypothetical protein
MRMVPMQQWFLQARSPGRRWLPDPPSNREQRHPVTKRPRSRCEPLLGDVQLELVRGMSRRLERGPPLSSEDRATYLDQLRILRVPGNVAGGLVS